MLALKMPLHKPNNSKKMENLFLTHIQAKSIT